MTPDAAEANRSGFVQLHDAIQRYAHAVQQADVDEPRSITFGVLGEQLPLENTS